MRRLGLLVLGVLLMVDGPAFAQDTSHGEFSLGWARQYRLRCRRSCERHCRTDLRC